MDDAGLFANRPIKQRGYLCSATSEPWTAMLAVIQRDKNIVTRCLNDVERGAVLRRLETVPDMFIAVRASVIDERMSAYIDAWRRTQEELTTLEAEVSKVITDMPRVPVNARPATRRTLAVVPA